MADVTIVGSGIAGLFVALRCARSGLQVALVTKKRLSDSSTNRAQGGIAGVLDHSDKTALEAHIQDTISSGAGLCDEEIVRMVVNEAAERIQDLVDEGVNFDKSEGGDYELAMEGGHKERRILHAKDATGAEIERALISSCRSEDNVTIYEDCFALDLILDDIEATQRKVVGLWCLDSKDQVFTLPSRAIVLATGGAGQLWRNTTNPSVATGDGIAMAVRAGARVRDLEFVQFHPTAYTNNGSNPFLITEAVRGDGAVLMTAENHSEWKKHLENDCNADPNEFSFMRQSDPRGSLATRDIVARTIDKELKRSGKHEVLLITEHLDSEHLANRFPNIANRMNKNGIQIGIDPIPVAPAAHYIVGGLAVNEWGEVLQRNLQTDKQTSSPQEGKILQGLFAIGEVACTGLHGANRLASNSLLEAVVFSHRAGIRVIEWLNQEATNDSKLPNWRADGLTSLEEHTPLVHDKNELRSTMSDDVGIVKNNWRLSRAERRLSLLDKEVELIWRSCKPTKELVELRNMIQLGQMVIRASIQRKENIGLHYNLNLT